MAEHYEPANDYVKEFLESHTGEFTTNEIRVFLSTKPGRSPTNGINHMLIDLSPKYVEPIEYQGANHKWFSKSNYIDDLDVDLKESYPDRNLTSSKFRSKM